jgi:hypothetical protein
MGFGRTEYRRTNQQGVDKGWGVPDVVDHVPGHHGGSADATDALDCEHHKLIEVVTGGGVKRMRPRVASINAAQSLLQTRVALL